MRRQILRTGEQARRLRLDVGVSLTTLAEVVGVHRTYLARIESGRAAASIEVLTAIGVALGADLGVRWFPGAGPRLHDRFQAPMVEALLRSLDSRWSAEIEVPVATPARGVIDVVLTDRAAGVAIAGEVQSELRRLEEQVRWASEKSNGLANQFDAGSVAVSKLLVLRSTTSTREIARRYQATLAAAYPARTRDVVLALTNPTAPWPGAGIVWIHHHGETTTLMPYPPPRVALGR